MDKLNMKVSGNKIINFQEKAGKKGYIEDRFGNKIYLTDSQENQKRLAKLATPKVVKKTVKKAKTK